MLTDTETSGEVSAPEAGASSPCVQTYYYKLRLPYPHGWVCQTLKLSNMAPVLPYTSEFLPKEKKQNLS